MVPLGGLPASGPVELRLAQSQGGPYVMEGGFWIPATPQQAWQALTDYEGIPGFVPSLARSQVLARSGGHVLIRQEARLAFLFFRRHMEVRLDVLEEPFLRISFKDSLREDFEIYEGSWEIREVSGGAEVVYRLRARPRFALPGWLARRLFASQAGDLLSRVRLEILRKPAPQMSVSPRH